MKNNIIKEKIFVKNPQQKKNNRPMGRQQEFFGEIELINNKSFEGKFTINELGEFKHIQSGCVFREENILLKREFTENEKEYYGKRDIIKDMIFLIFYLLSLAFVIFVIYHLMNKKSLSIEHFF